MRKRIFLTSHHEGLGKFRFGKYLEEWIGFLVSGFGNKSAGIYKTLSE